MQNFGEPQYNRCELRWSWTDLYAGHENKSIIFKTGTVGEWAVYLLEVYRYIEVTSMYLKVLNLLSCSIDSCGVVSHSNPAHLRSV